MAAACGGAARPSNETPPAAGGATVGDDDAGPLGATVDAAPDDAATCRLPVAPPDSGVPVGQNYANGDVTGPSATASFCDVDLQITAYPNGATGMFNLNIDSNSAFSSSTATVPSAAVGERITGSISFSAPVGGFSAVTSFGAQTPDACTTLTYSYGVLDNPQLDCSPDAYACPAGCSPQYYSCPDASFCCVPLATTTVYQVRSACSSSPTGAWNLTLTSLKPFKGDAGPYNMVYIAHGTLSATLFGQTDATDSVELRLRF